MSVTSEHLDAAKADALIETMRAAGSADQACRVTYLEQLEGGWSRHSYATRVDHGDGDGDERGYIVRVRPEGSLLDTDLGQEFRTYELLTDEPIPTPGVHGYEQSTETPFGGPFFVMDRLEGHAINVWRERDREEMLRDWEGQRGVAKDLADNLAVIHGVAQERAVQAAAPLSFQENVTRWRDIYDEMRLVNDPVVDEAFAWVRDREPDPVPACLVHGDYRIGNCLTDGRRITGILDWELSYVGDPRFDFGYMDLTYQRGKLVKPGSELLSAVAEHEWFYERYTAASGRPVDPEVVRTFTALGGLMLYTIMSTGVRVFADRRTTDIRMAWGRWSLVSIRQDLAALMDW